MQRGNLNPPGDFPRRRVAKMPPMHPGHALTIWTIRLALVAFVVACGLSVPRPRRLHEVGARYRRAQDLWLFGCLALGAHLAAAFHFYHDWSPARAWQDTARQTQELMGWSFGDGIYFSYIFALLWTADALWWRLAPANYLARPAPLRLAVAAYLAFIAFNGAVVFEAGVTRWAGLAVTPALAAYLYVRSRQRQA